MAVSSGEEEAETRGKWGEVGGGWGEAGVETAGGGDVANGKGGGGRGCMGVRGPSISVLKFWEKNALFSETWEKVAIFQKFCCQFQNLRLGVCLAKCLKFPEFEAGCAYKLIA